MKALKSFFRSSKTSELAAEPNDGGFGHFTYKPGVRIPQELLGPRTKLEHTLGAQVYRVSPTVLVKAGDGVRLAEAASLRFVREKTSLPVPEVFDAYVDEGSGHAVIVMEYIEGKDLDAEWDSYTQEQKEHIVRQLKSYLDQLRAIPGNFVGSVDGSHCEDQFFDGHPDFSGPFDSVSAFHAGLVKVLQATGSYAWTKMVIRFIESLPDCKIVFTHNDIAPRNILVKDGSIVGIVDWDFAGFYPEYWEYVGHVCWANWQSSFVQEEVIDRVLKPYLTELAYMKHMRSLLW